MKKSYDQKTTEFYQIKIKGRLDKEWVEWFEGMEIEHIDDNTIIRGPVRDQAALHGLLARIRDLNLVLLSLESLGSKGVEK